MIYPLLKYPVAGLSILYPFDEKHIIRKGWKNRGHRDPFPTALLSSWAATYALASLVALLIVMSLGGFWMDSPANTSWTILVVATVFVTSVSAIHLSAFFLNNEQKFFLNYETIKKALGLSDQEMMDISETEMIARAVVALKDLAKAVLESEKQFGPHCKERIPFRQALETAYRAFYKHGLIEDDGFGKYYQAAAVA